MAEEQGRNNHTHNAKPRPYKVNLPGFITEEDIGLGDVIKRATSAVGIKP